MRNVFIFFLGLLPCILQAQENEIYFNYDTTGLSSCFIALEDAYTTHEKWVVFSLPDEEGQVRISNQGYMTSDLKGKVVVDNIDSSAYLIVSEVMRQLFSIKYYWFSQKHYNLNQDLQKKEDLTGGNKTYFSTINGEEFTCQANAEYILDTYRKVFPDVVLVAKLPSDEGIILHHN